MKSLFFCLSLAFIICSCGSNPSEEKSSAPTSGTLPQNTSENTKPQDSALNALKKNPDYTKGIELVAKSDCFTCHKIEDPSIGPSYRSIANKYESNAKNVALLADKIVKGGSGTWGQVPMTPHSGLTKKEAEQMVKYILLLKKSS